MSEELSLERQCVELYTRAEVAKLLKIGIGHIDMIPETELPRVHIGKSIRFRLSIIKEFLDMKETKKQITIKLGD
jgi:hypothetical protein